MDWAFSIKKRILFYDKFPVTAHWPKGNSEQDSHPAPRSSDGVAHTALCNSQPCRR